MDFFLAQRGIEDEHRAQIVDEIFEKIDRDQNGFVDILEFSQQYVSTKNQLAERENELKQNILSNNTKLKQAKEELARAQKIHGNFRTGPMGTLYVTVIRADNLHGVNNSHVLCYQGNKHQQTRPAKGTSPNYGGQQLMFEVDDDQTPLVIQVRDIENGGVTMLETNIVFEDLKAENWLKEEFWLSTREEDPSAPKLRLKISYDQNEVLKWDGEVDMLTNDIKNDAGVLGQVRFFIDQLQAPFGFLKRDALLFNSSGTGNNGAGDTEPDHRYHAQEQEMEKKFDAAVDILRRRYKIETIPWLELTKVVVWIFLILTVVQMLKRPVFLSLTVAALALYILEYPQTIQRNTFRQLVLLLAISWVYDFLTLFLIEASATEEDEEDGGNEYKLRRFTRLFSYITLIFKVMVVLVFWKDSLDFRNIVHSGVSSSGPSDAELEDIIAEYSNDF